MSHSVQRLPTGWKVRGSNVGGGEIFNNVQTGPGAHTVSCIMGTWSFPLVKRPGRGVDHPPTSSSEAVEIVELYIYSLCGPSWPVLQ